VTNVVELVTGATSIDVRSLRFLIVDDDDDQRFLLSRTLAGMGAARIDEAASGRSALEMLDGTGTTADVVISDLQMPDIDGMELVRRIGERGLPLAVVLVSALDGALLGSAATMTQAYGVRIIGTIEKPATRDKLAAVLAHYTPPLAAPTAATDIAFEATPESVLAGLSAGQFEPYFQAIVELETGMVVGAEALARWQHPTRGLLGPETFLPHLGRAGYLDELSWIMLALAALEAGRWRRAGLRLTVSVNVSATSLADPSYADAVTQVVAGQGLEPSEMILEVTETEAVINVAAALENVTRLRMKGFGLAIDDYGVGYSSMQELSRMPFTEVKIDRTFVAAAADAKHRTMIEHTIAVARELGLKTVAEGVETLAEHEMLARLGCDMIQGYFVAPPMDARDFLRWMEERRGSPGSAPFSRRAKAKVFGT
jgi:EAL domain-containing protein (putative c-di-GMP-specific phosphodiesterase class I)/CheY-like chemotaxis protein